MPFGPGKYGANAEKLLQEHGGELCVVILMGGRDAGFDVATKDPKMLQALPGVLRRVADDMEKDMKAGDEMFSLVCHECLFSTKEPAEFADHCLTTGHIGLSPEALAEGGGLAEFQRMLQTMQKLPDGGDLPAGMEIRRVSREDIEGDDSIPDDAKRKLLAQLDELERKQ